MDLYVDVSYDLHLSTFQTFDVYSTRQDTSNLICFIHGGAWRAEDKADHAVLARNLAISTGYPVALPNYRLTPSDPTPDNSLHHPAHAEDILHFLEFILTWHTQEGGRGRLPQRPNKLFLIGHSCSAHMLSTVLLRMTDDSGSVCPSEELVQSIAAVIVSEGIYDIDLLLSSFPGYRTWFIENTFGKRDSFENVSVFNATMNPQGQHISWFIIHSKGDTLVDMRQSEGMYTFLRGRSCTVSKSFDALEDEHNDILKSPQYVDLITRYIRRVASGEQNT